ncbi:MAG TPA: Gfo/Idh/MocA family oxidoreductase [Rhodocyclaceae bacterium]|nr:Gfo/Idh/MocA family oxidoreductase [Rhodocyclaceae bacterium]
MKKVKVYGAGSIGNHLANASRRMGWKVDICDVDSEALRRTREEIYPARYGKWDESIGLYANKDIPVGGYDLIVIGTPPDSHMLLARQAVKERPAAILVEKPLCTPDLAGAQELLDEAAAAGVHVFTGYDHVVGKSAQLFGKLLRERAVGELDTIDVEFREFWGGIFGAHPWLSGPADTYLGFWQRGGGSCGEHSHAANLWQYFAHEAGIGRVVEVAAEMEFVRDGRVDYDKLCLMTVRTESGLVGRVVQDVVTRPTRKWARVQGSAGFLEWYCGHEPGIDSVIHALDAGVVSNTRVSKTRPDDFVQELKHIEAVLEGSLADSPISLVRGLETMMVIAAAHKSAMEKRVVRIDYSKGYVPEALS